MKILIQIQLIISFIVFFGVNLHGQNIEFTLRLNITTSAYEVYARSDFDDASFFVGGGNQLSLVLPASVNDAPIAIQTANGGLWLDNSQIYAPEADSAHDFHSIASNGSIIEFISNEETLLFSFSFPGNPCIADIRLFENNSDPQTSDPGMEGGDFNNYFANVFDLTDYYNGNYSNTGTICLSPPTIDITQITVLQDSVNTVCTAIIDPNPGDIFNASLCSPAPGNGIAEVVVSADQLCLTYTALPGFIGSDEVCITVCDQTGLCTTSIIPVEVIPNGCPDTDGDGICDQVDNCPLIPNPDQADCDNDNEGDVCETDSDNDNVPDACDICVGNDATGDTDGDGICDDLDNCVFIMNVDQADCDNDGEGDVCEIDTDGDNIPDGCDICTGDDATGDTDGDGICDDTDNCVSTVNPDQADCDNDNEGDVCEVDSDGDNVPDACDICTGNDASGDTDGDGICDDIDNCVTVVNIDQLDCDDDGQGDACAPDTDSDNIPDGCDICMGDDASGDTDGDGICDDIDNCVLVFNPAQADCNNDGVGDFCEMDSDGDSVPDVCDICEGNDAFGDSDDDGICDEIPDCNTYQFQVSNDATECVQPFTDVNLTVEAINSNVNLDLFEITWTGPNDFISTNPGAVLPNIQSEDAGTYIAEITSLEAGCQYLYSTVVDVTVIPNEPQINASATVVCPGNELLLTISEYEGTEVHYEWNGPRGSTTSGAYPDQSVLSISNFTANDAGAYRVLVTVDECSSIWSSTVEIALQPALNAPPISGTNEVCAGGIISLQTSVIADEYIWTGPNGFTADQPNPHITISANSQHEGIYSLRVVTNDCTSPVSTFQINLSDTPTTPILELTNEICSGDDIILSVVNPTAASYQWIAPSASPNSSFGVLGDPNNVVWTVGSSTQISPSLNPAFYETGMWRVQALNDLGCVSEISTAQPVNIVNPPATAVVSSEGDVCENAPVYLHADPVPDVTFYWYDGNPASAPAGTLVAIGNDPILFNVSPGLHEYFVESVRNGCSSDTYGRVDVSVYEKPILSSINNPDIFCAGETIQLQGPDIPDATYHWIGQNGFNSNAQNPIISGITYEAEGTYLLYVEVNGCASDPLTTEVILSPEIAVPIAINNGPVCTGGDLLLSVANIDSTLTYEWFDSIGSVSIGTGPEILFEEVEADMAGTYYVVASLNNCSSNPAQVTNSGEDAFSQVVVEIADSDAAYVGDPLFACENSITVNALTSTTGSGLWTVLNGGPNTTILQPGQSSSLVINLQEGINELLWSVTSNSCGTIATDTLRIEWSNFPVAQDDVFEIEYNEPLNDMIVFENDLLNTEEFEISIATDVENGSLVLLDNNVLAYWPDQGFIGTESFEYNICNKNCEELCDVGLVTIRVAVGEDCEAASVMTPNGDGYNDTFIITCVLNHPGSILSIYNRWGNEIYFNSDYKNDWEGTYNGSPLPSGTYYYNLQLNDSEETKISGYIYIER